MLFADEVYQETAFTNEVQFHSCKKVLRDLGPEYNKFQLMSIHSASKGFYGEYVQVDFVICKTQQCSMRRALKQAKIKNILKQNNIPNYSMVIIWDSCKVFVCLFVCFFCFIREHFNWFCLHSLKSSIGKGKYNATWLTKKKNRQQDSFKINLGTHNGLRGSITFVHSSAAPR